MRSWLASAWLAWLACSCGRIGFDVSRDATSNTDSTDVVLPKLVGEWMLDTTATTLTVPAALGSGDLVVVVVDMFGTTFSVETMSDGSNAYVSAGARATDIPIGNATEIWYAADSRSSPGVTITLSGTVEAAVWVLEFDDIATAMPLDAVDHESGSAVDLVLGAAVTTGNSIDVVVSVEASDAPVSTLVSSSVFSALPLQGGDGVAYLVATQPASYMATWQLTMPLPPEETAQYASSSAAFRAAM